MLTPPKSKDWRPKTPSRPVQVGRPAAGRGWEDRGEQASLPCLFRNTGRAQVGSGLIGPNKPDCPICFKGGVQARLKWRVERHSKRLGLLLSRANYGSRLCVAPAGALKRGPSRGSRHPLTPRQLFHNADAGVGCRDGGGGGHDDVGPVVASSVDRGDRWPPHRARANARGHCCRDRRASECRRVGTYRHNLRRPSTSGR